MLLFDLQETMKKRIDENEEITWPVYDYVPENKAVKYIILGDVKARPFNTKTSEGKQITATVDLWAENRGMLDIKKVAFLIERELASDLESGEYDFEYHETELEEVKRETPELVHGRIQLVYRVEIEEEV